MHPSLEFQFVDDLDQFQAVTPGIVAVPVGLSSKPQLLREFVRLLDLPGYFGGNWDALDECLRDRLLDERCQPLYLVHRDLPLDQDAQQCGDYLSLLDDTLAWARTAATCEFAVIFPASAAETIDQLMGRNDRT